MLFFNTFIKVAYYLSLRLSEKAEELEEVKKMPYITSVERIGMEKGLQQGLQQGFGEMILEALDERFGEVPSEISNAVTKIEDRDTLKSLHRYAISHRMTQIFTEKGKGFSVSFCEVLWLK